MLDEFHRCGTQSWQENILSFLILVPNVPVLGLSAAAIRYLDNQRDMSAADQTRAVCWQILYADYFRRREQLRGLYNIGSIEVGYDVRLRKSVLRRTRRLPTAHAVHRFAGRESVRLAVQSKAIRQTRQDERRTEKAACRDKRDSDAVKEIWNGNICAAR